MIKKEELVINYGVKSILRRGRRAKEYSSCCLLPFLGKQDVFSSDDTEIQLSYVNATISSFICWSIFSTSYYNFQVLQTKFLPFYLIELFSSISISHNCIKLSKREEKNMYARKPASRGSHTLTRVNKQIVSMATQHEMSPCHRTTNPWVLKCVSWSERRRDKVKESRKMGSKREITVPFRTVLKSWVHLQFFSNVLLPFYEVGNDCSLHSVCIQVYVCVCVCVLFCMCVYGIIQTKVNVFRKTR